MPGRDHEEVRVLHGALHEAVGLEELIAPRPAELDRCVDHSKRSLRIKLSRHVSLHADAVRSEIAVVCRELRPKIPPSARTSERKVARRLSHRDDDLPAAQHGTCAFPFKRRQIARFGMPFVELTGCRAGQHGHRRDHNAATRTVGAQQGQASSREND